MFSAGQCVARPVHKSGRASVHQIALLMIKLSTLFQVKSVHIFINISLICWASHQIHVLKHWLSELYNSKWAQTRQPLIFKMDVGISENQPRCFSSSSSVEVSQLDGGGHFQSEKTYFWSRHFVAMTWKVLASNFGCFLVRFVIWSIVEIDWKWGKAPFISTTMIARKATILLSAVL